MSNTCSGAAQSNLQFSHVFRAMAGQASATALSKNGNVLPPQPNTNPSDAPYPQWSATASYPLNHKVVENGEIYQAKWFNTGQDPAAQAQYAWQSPWELIGPVLPGDHAPALPQAHSGSYPQWNVKASYHAGQKVLYQGLPYRARWANQGAAPSSNPGSAPWKPLYKIPGEPAG